MDNLITNSICSSLIVIKFWMLKAKESKLSYVSLVLKNNSEIIYNLTNNCYLTKKQAETLFIFFFNTCFASISSDYV